VYAESHEELMSSDLPTQYQLLVTQQNWIGWIQIFRGHWSNKWKTQHEKWRKSHSNVSRYQQGENWLSGLREYYLGGWLYLWKLQNDKQ